MLSLICQKYQTKTGWLLLAASQQPVTGLWRNAKGYIRDGLGVSHSRQTDKSPSFERCHAHWMTSVETTCVLQTVVVFLIIKFLCLTLCNHIFEVTSFGKWWKHTVDLNFPDITHWGAQKNSVTLLGLSRIFFFPFHLHSDMNLINKKNSKNKKH